MKTKAKAADVFDDDDPLDDYITVAEAAKRLRVGPPAIRRLGRTKKVRMFKLLGRFRVSKTSLDAYIKHELAQAQQ